MSCDISGHFSPGITRLVNILFSSIGDIGIRRCAVKKSKTDPRDCAACLQHVCIPVGRVDKLLTVYYHG